MPTMIKTKKYADLAYERLDDKTKAKVPQSTARKLVKDAFEQIGLDYAEGQFTASELLRAVEKAETN